MYVMKANKRKLLILCAFQGAQPGNSPPYYQQLSLFQRVKFQRYFNVVIPLKRRTYPSLNV